MAIPQFDPTTGYLPPGIHDATFAEIRRHLGFSPKRLQLISNLERIAKNLFDAGVAELCIDGSFVTQKPNPGDIDGYWTLTEKVNLDAIQPILLDFRRVPDRTGHPKFLMWHVYGVELFIHPIQQATAEGTSYPAFFSKSREDVARGYVRVVI